MEQKKQETFQQTVKGTLNLAEVADLSAELRIKIAVACNCRRCDGK